MAISSEALMIFTDGWLSSNDIHETINYCCDQIWEMTIVLKLSYDLPHEPVPKLMSSRVLVPIRDIKTYANVHEPFATKCKVFCAQYCTYIHIGLVVSITVSKSSLSLYYELLL